MTSRHERQAREADARRERADERRDAELDARMREIETEILGRNPESKIVPTLDRINRVMELMGDPQRQFPVVHITGTNGKTTTTRMVEALLREHGLTTGRFTSPHLHNVRERIAINGEPLSVERFVAAYEDVAPFIAMVDGEAHQAGTPRMTYFEVIVAIAYAAFADAPVHVAVVEVGLGGSWDATNVADGQVAVVTPIGLDHQAFLGDTIEAIATEKAGILKPGAIAILAEQDPDEPALEVLLGRAEQVGATAAVEGVAYGVESRDVAVGGQLLKIRGLAGSYPDVLVPLFGEHQAHNAATALAATEAFLGGGEQRLDPDVVRAGFHLVTSPGRLEIVRRSPTVLVDAAHNPHGAASLRQALAESFTFARVVGLVAVLQDKDAYGILSELEPAFDHVVVSRTTSARSMRPADLGRLAEDIFGADRVTVVQDLPDALETAAALAEQETLGGGTASGVVATGSITTAAEVRMLLGVTSA